MGQSFEVDGKQFLKCVEPLMVRLFCLPAEERTSVMAALLAGIEERLEKAQWLSRADFLVVFQWVLDNEDSKDSTPHEFVSRAAKPV
jgi:hypothetical protein